MPRYKHPDQLINKKHSVYDLYHEVCGQFLSGNGSYITPYKCDCGEWEYDTKTYDWRLKKNEKN